MEEMAAWSLDEIRDHIQRLLPEGHTFVSLASASTWLARIEDPDGTRLWEKMGLDQRILLLDAFGWLWLQGHASPEPGTPWARKLTLEPQPVAKRSSRDPDPEDLDPEEVKAVYGLGRKNN